jgi:hypothetical protein
MLCEAAMNDGAFFFFFHREKRRALPSSSCCWSERAIIIIIILRIRKEKMELKKVMKDKKFWFASFLITWAAALQVTI